MTSRSSRPTLGRGMIVEVISPGMCSGQKFVGRRFTLGEASLINGMWCWRAPESWSRYMTSVGAGANFDLHIQEERLRFISNGDCALPGGWEASPWRPHIEVIPDPRPGREGRLVNVWDPLGDYGPDRARGMVGGVPPDEERE